MTTTNLPPLLRETEQITNKFLDANKSLYLVGGVVRDLLLDRDITANVDLDLTTDALPDEIKQIVSPIAENLWLSGEKFGTIGIHHNGRAYEITTHRAESYDLDSRKPQVTYSTDINQDLSRRDFTINAMAISLPEGTLIDPFNGQEDLQQGLLRTPLTPQESFSDDPLRMLRAARFIAAYNLVPDSELITAVGVLGDRFSIVSAERTLGEFDKLLQAPQPEQGLHLLHDSGLLRLFLPEVPPERFQHISKLPSDPNLRAAALLATTPSKVCKNRLRELRYSKERITVICRVIEGAKSILDDPSGESDYRRWYHQIGEYRERSYQVAKTLSDEALQIWEEMESTRTRLAEELDDFSLPISGDEVMELLQIEEGRSVGEAMEYLQEQRFERGPFTDSDAREMLRDWWDLKK